MKYNLFDNTKTIELADDLVNLYEKEVHPINNVVLEGIVASENAEDKSEEEITCVILGSMVETAGMYENTEEVLNRIRSLIRS